MNSEELVTRTRSRLRMWYLTIFGGLRVRSVYTRPIGLVLGFLYYNKSWILVPVEGL